MQFHLWKNPYIPIKIIPQMQGRSTHLRKPDLMTTSMQLLQNRDKMENWYI